MDDSADYLAGRTRDREVARIMKRPTAAPSPAGAPPW